MRYYFLGICGTAMASLAVLLKQKGNKVWGSDQGIYPPMSDFLKSHDIRIWEGYDSSHLSTPFDKVVIGNALSRGNPEVEEILRRKLSFTSLPELIRDEFIRDHRNIVISGTHGKTTTTALVGWILSQAQYDPTVLVGGIAKNFQSSIVLGEGEHFVIEGDEYDCAFFDKRPKFIHYFPDYLIINNVEFDHADIYPNLAAISEQFRKLLRIVPADGLVVANGDHPQVREVCREHYSRLQFYGKGEENHWGYQILQEDAGGAHFRLFEEGKAAAELLIPFPGEFMVQNAVAAVAVCRDIGLSYAQIGSGLKSFAGVDRRMQFWGRFAGADVYDDFAHHPTAIAVTLKALRQKHPQRRLVALFEPRTNTTVRNTFQRELAEALSLADLAVLTPIYRSDRLPETQRLSLEKLAADLQENGTQLHLLQDFHQIEPALRQILQEGDVLVLLTNGSLGGKYAELRKKIAGAEGA